jgi:FixJ family two-component response regulator
MGYNAEAFASAEAFLHSGQRANTDCIVLDVRMPGMSGLELQRVLATANSHIPIIFITAHGDDQVRLQALSDGAVDFLFKPFSEEAMLKAVDRALKS